MAEDGTAFRRDEQGRWGQSYGCGEMRWCGDEVRSRGKDMRADEVVYPALRFSLNKISALLPLRRKGRKDTPHPAVASKR